MTSRTLKAILGFLAVLLADLSLAQSPVFTKIWDKRFGGLQDESVSSFQLTPDGGFIIGGSSSSGISGDKTQNNWDTTLVGSDYWIVRTDSLSNLLWERRFGGVNTDLMNEIVMTGSGDYLLGGQSYSAIGGDKSQFNWDPTQMSSDYWVVKVDDNGNKLWDKRFGGNSFEIFGSVKESPTGSIYLTGSSFSPTNGDKTEANVGGWDFWIVRTNASGIKIWDRTFGGTNDDFAVYSIATADGGVIVGGYSNSDVSGDKSEPSRGSWDYWMVKIDSTGNKVWDKTLGGDYLDYLFSMAHTNDGGIIAAGQSYSGATGDKSEPNHDATQAGSDYWIIKLDGQGNVLWDRTYGASQVEQLSKVSPTSDSGFLLSGESYSPVDGDKSEPNLGMEQTWVVKIDSVGNIIWDKTIFTTGHDELGTAIEVSPLCFVAVNYTAADTGGYKSQMSWGVGDYWMVKVCENDPTGLTENSPLQNQISLHPNPANEILHISMADEIYGSVMLQIFDVTGREVLSGSFSNADWTRGITYDISRLQNGYYILKLSEKTGTAKSVAFIKG